MARRLSHATDQTWCLRAGRLTALTIGSGRRRSVWTFAPTIVGGRGSRWQSIAGSLGHISDVVRRSQPTGNLRSQAGRADEDSRAVSADACEDARLTYFRS